MNSEDHYTLLLMKEHFTHLRHTFEQHNDRLTTLLEQALSREREHAGWIVQAKLDIHVHYLNKRANFLNSLSIDCLQRSASTWQEIMRIMKCYRDDYKDVIQEVMDEEDEEED